MGLLSFIFKRHTELQKYPVILLDGVIFSRQPDKGINRCFLTEYGDKYAEYWPQKYKGVKVRLGSGPGVGDVFEV